MSDGDKQCIRIGVESVMHVAVGLAKFFFRIVSMQSLVPSSVDQAEIMQLLQKLMEGNQSARAPGTASTNKLLSAVARCFIKRL